MDRTANTGPGLRKAFVEVSFMDNGPSFASAYPVPPVARAEVVEVSALTSREAETIANEKMDDLSLGMGYGFRARFLRWSDETGESR